MNCDQFCKNVLWIRISSCRRFSNTTGMKARNFSWVNREPSLSRMIFTPVIKNSEQMLSSSSSLSLSLLHTRLEQGCPGEQVSTNLICRIFISFLGLRGGWMSEIASDNRTTITHSRENSVTHRHWDRRLRTRCYLHWPRAVKCSASGWLLHHTLNAHDRGLISWINNNLCCVRYWNSIQLFFRC